MPKWLAGERRLAAAAAAAPVYRPQGAKVGSLVATFEDMGRVISAAPPKPASRPAAAEPAASSPSSASQSSTAPSGREEDNLSDSFGDSVSELHFAESEELRRAEEEDIVPQFSMEGGSPAGDASMEGGALQREYDAIAMLAAAHLLHGHEHSEGGQPSAAPVLQREVVLRALEQLQQVARQGALAREKVLRLGERHRAECARSAELERALQASELEKEELREALESSNAAYEEVHRALASERRKRLELERREEELLARQLLCS